jgi:GxxExxY protein
LLIEREVVVEIKSVNRLAPIVEAQALTYLKLLGLRRALILNFNVTLLRDGITRLVR